MPNAVKPLFTQLCNIQVGTFRHGRVVLATHVITLFRVDPNWAALYLLPLFDWEQSSGEARAAWEGFLGSPRLYWPLLEAIKREFLATAGHYAQLGRRNDQYAALLTFAALQPGGIFSRAELATATRTLPSGGLHAAAQALVRALEGTAEQRGEYWHHRVLPYIKSIWPKSRSAMTPAISENFARLCVATQDTFPVALHELKDWLQAVEYPDSVVHLLHDANLPERFPEEALTFLNIVVADGTQLPPSDLSECLQLIRNIAPALKTDERFHRLMEYLRKHGKIT